MPARLVLHLGDFKTGTTALQRWLEESPPPELAALPGAPHAGLATGLGDPAGTRARLAGIGRALDAAKAPALVVSAEHFEFANPARLKEALAAHLPGIDLRLLAWVRPHGAAYLARYGESAKVGAFAGPPEAYLDWPPTRRRMAYAARFGRWRAAFGDRFALHLYAREALPGGDIRRAFARAAAGTDPGPLPAGPGPNPALGTEGLALARAVQAAIGPLPADEAAKGARFTLGRAIGRVLAARPGAADDPPLVADRALAHRLHEAFFEDAAALDAAFFGPGQPLTDSLRAALADAPDTAPGPDPDRLAPEARATAQLWGRMLAEGLATPARAHALGLAFHERPPPD